ncbi:MAG: hypothetical protein ACLFSY_04925 [Desulfonatronovibrionaceae bacterium]
MIPGETIQSPLPQDLPWWNPDHFVFFGVLYAVILVLASGLGVTILKSISDTLREKKKEL